MRVEMNKKFLKVFTSNDKSEERNIIQTDQEEMKEETHELEQVEQDAQEEIRETEDE
jgi:hypothetical protein